MVGLMVTSLLPPVAKLLSWSSRLLAVTLSLILKSIRKLISFSNFLELAFFELNHLGHFSKDQIKKF